MKIYVLKVYSVAYMWERPIIRGYYKTKESAEKNIPEDKHYYEYYIEEVEVED